MVSIPANTSLSDALRKSPIIDDGASGGGAGFGGGFEIDEAADPELAMALRISLEEQRARQQQVLRFFFKFKNLIFKKFQKLFRLVERVKKLKMTMLSSNQWIKISKCSKVSQNGLLV